MKKNLFSPQDLRYMFGVTRNTLRFYEKKDLLKPSAVDPDTGYRYYGFAELEKLHLIMRYKESGMTLAEIKSYLKGEISASDLEKTLEKRLEAVRNGLELLRSHENKENQYAVERITLPECVCVVEPLVWTGSEASGAEFCDLLFHQKSSFFKVSQKYPDFSEWSDDSLVKSGFLGDSIPVNICVEADPADPPENAVIYPPTEAVATYHAGGYNTIALAYNALLSYMEKNNLEQNGHAREIYLLGPYAVDEERFLTKIMIPVREKQS